MNKFPELDTFIDVADEVLFEGRVELAEKMLDAYVTLRAAIADRALRNFQKCIDAHGGLEAITGAVEEES